MRPVFNIIWHIAHHFPKAWASTLMLAIAFGAFVVLSTPPALSQRLPSSDQPGRLQQRFEKPVTPQSLPPVEFPTPEQAPPPDKAGAIRFTLRDLVLDGGSIYSSGELRPLYESLLGQEISLLDLYKVRDAITAKYRSDGWVLSLAVIPAQRIIGGVVHLALVEGYVGTVHFEGPHTDRFGILKDYAERIRASRPLKAAVLERYVMLMDDLPGFSVHTVLKPAKSGEPGSDLTVAIERKPVEASLTLDNRGTKSVGPYQFDAGVDLNDQLGTFDQTSVHFIFTPHLDELRYLDITHTENIGFEGSTWVTELRRNWSQPGSDIRQYGIASQGLTLRTGLSYPLIRSRSETLRLSTDFTVANSWSHAQGAPLSNDRTRALGLNVSWDFSDSWQGSNLFQAGYSRGFDVFSAYVSDQSRQDAQLTFSKLTATAQRVQPLPENFSLLLAVDSQYSPNRLVSAQQFGVGGKLYGRGFDSSTITGDTGASVKSEVQYTPEIQLSWLKYLQLFTFGDYGRSWTYTVSGNELYQFLASAGGGFRFGLGDRVSGTFEVATPLSFRTTANDNPGLRAFFTLSAKY